jgi:ADP-heptose:LPS heptosyltransferase
MTRRVLASRRRPRRWWLFQPLDLLARLWPVWRRRSGVLVVRLDGIGDMVMAHGALCRYGEALGIAPGEITILGCDSWASVASALYRGFRFRAIAEHAYERNPLYRVRISLWVRRQGFAVAICDSFLRRPLAADALIYVSGAPRRMMAKPYQSPKTEALFAWYLARCHQTIDTGPYPTHEIVRHYRFLSVIAGREIAPSPPLLPWPRGRRLLAAAYAVVNIGSNEPGRRWPLSSFLETAEHLARRGILVVFVGGPGEAALAGPVGAAVGASLWGDRLVDRINRTSLPDLLNLLHHALIVISGDTGPAHLAIGLGAPTVVILGGGHFTSFVPYPAALAPRMVRFLWREMPCYHCFWRCTQPRAAGASYPCLQAVTVAQVCDAIDVLLARRSPQTVPA